MAGGGAVADGTAAAAVPGGDAGAIIGAAGAVRVNRTVPRMVSPSSATTCQVNVYAPAGPAALTGAVTVASVTVACPTVHTAPSGPGDPDRVRGQSDGLTEGERDGGRRAARRAPAAGLLVSSSVWASAGRRPEQHGEERDEGGEGQGSHRMSVSRGSDLQVTTPRR